MNRAQPYPQLLGIAVQCAVYDERRQGFRILGDADHFILIALEMPIASKPYSLHVHAFLDHG